MSSKRPYPDTYLNDTVPQFCKECAKYSYCTLCHDEQLRERCPLLQEDIPLFYKNSEGYSDPTTFFALRNVEREQKRKAKGIPDQRKEQRKPKHNTQVTHY